MNSMAFLRLICLSLILASALRCTDSGSITGTENPDPQSPGIDENRMGTIAGTVTAGGSPIPGVVVRVTSSFRPRGSAITDADGAFSFSVRAGGPYSVTAGAAGTACPSESAMVEADQTVTVDIVCQPTGVILGNVRWTNKGFVSPEVVVSGPVTRKAEPAFGGFTFDGLPPGDYTVTASLRGCQSVNATVQVAQITRVEIVCQLPSFSEIGGNWFIYLPSEDDFGHPLTSQAGNCPPLLPHEGRRGSIAFDPGSGAVSIEGLDPDVTIVGDLRAAERAERSFDPGLHRDFGGAGSAVRGDSSSIRSEVNGTFGFSTFEGGSFYFFGTMTRVHRSPGGDPVCTETYWVEGNNFAR